MAGLLVLATAVAGWRWWTGAEVLAGGGEAMVAPARPVDRATLHVALVDPPVGHEGAVVTLSGVEADVVQDSARSTVRFAVCDQDGDPFGAVTGSLDRYCSRLEPVVDGTRLDHRPDSGQVLVMTIAPTGPGRTEVDGVDVSYALDRSHLWRRGHQRLPVGVTVPAR